VRTAQSVKVIGSSTATVVILQANNVLQSLNVGDSTFLVVRDGRVFFQQQQQQYRFNFPYQLGTQSEVLPRDGLVWDVPAIKDDIVVLATGNFVSMVNTTTTTTATPLTLLLSYQHQMGFGTMCLLRMF
jgi:hypothetical protein